MNKKIAEIDNPDNKKENFSKLFFDVKNGVMIPAENHAAAVMFRKSQTTFICASVKPFTF